MLRARTLESAGSARVRVKLSRTGKRHLRHLQRAKLRLRLSVRDAAGNERVVSRGFVDRAAAAS